MLRSMRNEWEMGFVDGGQKALQRMAEAPFDVVVSDMRMPGMSGAELLNEVMQHYPRTVRLILSGHSDRDLILRCVGATHQYLAKPCQSDVLIRTIRRAIALEGTLQNEVLRQLATKMDRLPTLPSLYSEIMERCQDPQTDLNEVARIVARDLGMAAEVLKLVNSAFFGLGRSFADVQDAVAYLGLETIKALVLSMGAFAQFQDLRPGLLSLDEIWRHSAATAVAARSIARLETAERKVTDEAFVAGLLHDAGKLVLAANFPAEYEAARRAAQERGTPSVVAEREVFAASHAEVGGYLLGLWGLPVPVVEAVALHHSPELSVCVTFSPLTAVHVADAMEEAASTGCEGPGHGEINVEYLKGLGLADHVATWEEAVRHPTEEWGDWTRPKVSTVHAGI